MRTKELNELECRVITCLHMGVWNKMRWGSMKKKARLAVLLDLTARGFLDDKCRPTPKGIDAAAPSNWIEK